MGMVAYVCTGLCGVKMQAVLRQPEGGMIATLLHSQSFNCKTSGGLWSELRFFIGSRMLVLLWEGLKHLGRKASREDITTGVYVYLHFFTIRFTSHVWKDEILGKKE